MAILARLMPQALQEEAVVRPTISDNIFARSKNSVRFFAPNAITRNEEALARARVKTLSRASNRKCTIILRLAQRK